jgi:proline iminopeptidase
MFGGMMRILYFLLFVCVCAFTEGVADESMVKSDGAQLFCKVLGKGDPIIVIHGGPGLSHDYLLPGMAKLAENHQVIFYDQRGCGRSTGVVNADTIQVKKFVEDIEAVRKSLGNRKIIVLGHSWGGFLAMQYAISHPGSVEKLILLNTMPPSSEAFSLFTKEWTRRMEPYQDQLKAIQESSAFAEGDPATMERYYLMNFKRYCYEPAKAHLLNLCMTPKAAVEGMKVYEIFNQTLLSKPFNYDDQLKQLKVPTLIVHGDCDIIPCSTIQKLHKTIAGSQYVLIKHCGHFPYVEQPEELFKHIDKFLGVHLKTGGPLPLF